MILVRADLKLPKGKLAAQVGHAVIDAAWASNKRLVKKWKGQGMKKVVLKVKDEKELFEFEKKFEEADIVTSMIIDAGHTTVEPGTLTCMGIGPAPEGKLDKICGHLKML